MSSFLGLCRSHPTGIPKDEKQKNLHAVKWVSTITNVAISCQFQEKTVRFFPES
jgi:hypothetical protein